MHFFSGKARNTLGMSTGVACLRNSFCFRCDLRAPHFMLPISALLRRFRLPHSKYIDVYDGPKIEFMVMSLHKPAEVPREIAKQLATQLHIGDVPCLKKHLV